ncbi:MAG: type II toxin-antitoxin system RelE/ParE family toxin [Caldilineaceae bacterium]
MYQLKLKGSARKQLHTLATVSQRLHSDASAIILDLREEPRPPDALAMVDEYAGIFRLRFNNHRIIYAVDDGTETVTIWTIKPRDRKTYNSII